MSQIDTEFDIFGDFYIPPVGPYTLPSDVFSALAGFSRPTDYTRAGTIESTIFKYERRLQRTRPSDPGYEYILARYADALLLRWNSTHQIKDIKKAIVSLEEALDKLGTDPSKQRYNYLVTLGAAYMDRYMTHDSDLGDTLKVAKYWEEAEIVAVSLGNTRESVSVEELFCWKLNHSCLSRKT
jgi:hypothetical protein